MIPVFDLGNVIVQVDFLPFQNWLIERSANKEAAQIAVENAIHLEFEKGLVSPEKFVAEVRDQLNADFSQQEFFEKFNNIFPSAVPEMKQVLADLRQRDAVYCLSNTNQEHLAFIEKMYPEMELFSEVYASHDLQMRKPDQEIYDEVAARLDVKPEKLVFFDDRPENIEAATAAGWQAHVFQNADHVRSVLKI